MIFEASGSTSLSVDALLSVLIKITPRLLASSELSSASSQKHQFRKEPKVKCIAGLIRCSAIT